LSPAACRHSSTAIKSESGSLVLNSQKAIMTKVVAVCGATGKQGGATVAALQVSRRRQRRAPQCVNENLTYIDQHLQKLGGFKIIALTRNPDNVAAQCLAAPNVEVRLAVLLLSGYI
jgi:hypothetical protein